MRLDKLRRQILSALGRQPLVYLGLKGGEAGSLSWIPNIETTLSYIAAPPGERSESLEEMLGFRPELNSYSLENDDSEAAERFRTRLRRSLLPGTFLFYYRPFAVVTTEWVLSQGQFEPLGLLAQNHKHLEDKAYVDTAIARVGIPSLEWRYQRGLTEIPEGLLPAVLRARHGSGGSGCSLLTRNADVEAVRGTQRPGELYGWSPYLDLLPVSLNCCLFRNGSVSFHASSIQLIGVGDCTNLSLGFCGSDFGAIKVFSQQALRRMEATARSVAAWMHSGGYYGAFGVDVLADENQCYFVELNPRFQSSSMVSASIDTNSGNLDQLTAHLAAHLGLDPPALSSLSDIIRNQPDKSQVVVYNVEYSPVTIGPFPADHNWQLVHQPRKSLRVMPGAIMASLLFDRRVTLNGHQIDRDAAQFVKELRAVAAAGDISAG